MQPSLCVLGAGSWGTALAIQAARNGFKTALWGHTPEHIERLISQRENIKYLPGYPFPPSLYATLSLEEAIKSSSIILLSVPSHAFQSTLIKIKPFLSDQMRIAWATKGFNNANGSLLHEVVENTLGISRQTAVLSGPTFATEVASGLPTAITIASLHTEFCNELASIFHNQTFRPYTSHDIIGVQIGGAVKNVLAIAAGIADGLGYGANTRAALITRGLHEIIRLGTQMGGQIETFMGLAGLGDLVLTCTDNQSRNRRFGLALGSGKTPEQASAEIQQEVEGRLAAKETFLLSQRYAIEMPISEQTYKVLYENLAPQIALQNLLGRNPKAES